LSALAAALDVPPLWLTIDPESHAPVPITAKTSTDWATAALWVMGQRALERHTSREWAVGATALRLTLTVDQLFQSLEASRTQLYFEEKHAGEEAERAQKREDADRRDRSILTALARILVNLREMELAVPPLPEDVQGRARELQVDLGVRDDA
jgi:hypothetical protein